MKPRTACTLSKATKCFLRAVCFWIAAATIGTHTAPASAADNPIRFAVAHKHSFSWCYGYLYVTPDLIRYEVVQPESSQDHSFEVRRSDLQARQWTALGVPQQGVEIRIQGATQIFMWLASEREVRTGGSWRPTPPMARPPEPLLAVLSGKRLTKDRASRTAESAARPAADAAGSANTASNDAAPAAPGLAPQSPALPAETGNAGSPAPAVTPLGNSPGGQAGIDRGGEPIVRPAGPLRFNADIGYVAPAGWSVRPSNGAVEMDGPVPPQEAPCFVLLLPPQPAQANLPAQAEAIVNGLFAARFGRYMDDLERDVKFSTYDGVSGTGWHYVELWGRLGNRGGFQLARIVLAQMGNQVVPLVGFTKSKRCLGNSLEREHYNWSLLFHSLQLPGFTQESPLLQQQLLGSWEAVGSHTYSSKTFAANGQFGRVGGHSTYTESQMPGFLLQKTSTWVGDGTYEVHADRLTTLSPTGIYGGKAVTELFSIVRHMNPNKPGGFEYLFRTVTDNGSGEGPYVPTLVKQ